MGPKPPTPPQWKEETYELNTQDVLVVLEQQIGTTEFDSQFETTLYKEYRYTGNYLFPNLISGY
jgi:hypothetical protein